MRSAGHEGTRAKVWYLAHWGRHELREDRRNAIVGPLRYVQLQIRSASGDDDDAQLELERLALLARPGGLAAWGVYTLLLMMGGNRSRPYRGYLLDHRNRPASTRMIAGLIHVPLADVRQAMKVLASAGVGLLERVPLPDFRSMEIPQSRRAGGADPARRTSATCTGDSGAANGC